MLLQNGADVNVAASFSTTALHKAAWKGHVSVVKVLVQNSADVNALDEGDWTLFTTQLRMDMPMRKVLIQNG